MDVDNKIDILGHIIYILAQDVLDHLIAKSERGDQQQIRGDPDT